MHGPREAQTRAVAYRIDYKGQSITISGDLNFRSGSLVKLAKDSDILSYDSPLGSMQRIDAAGTHVVATDLMTLDPATAGHYKSVNEGGSGGKAQEHRDPV